MSGTIEMLRNNKLIVSTTDMIILIEVVRNFVSLFNPYITCAFCNKYLFILLEVRRMYGGGTKTVINIQ